VVLSAENKKQLMVPHGPRFFGFEQTASVIYKVDQVYHKERGIRYDDPTLAIDWRLDANEIIVSEKDIAEF
jgi:dTDP-4-dehydrorhamnose 3,5-epimerase